VSQTTIDQINQKYKKSQVVDVHSGDTVRVHQKIREGNKERVQVFQGLVIRIDRKNSHTHRITVRRISSGVGVEKSFLLHSPLVIKVEVTKRSKVRRNYLSYMRALTGKATRLSGVGFDSTAVNTVAIDDEAEEEKDKEEPQIKDTAEEPKVKNEVEKEATKDTKEVEKKDTSEIEKDTNKTEESQSPK
jgi:large subunit ribosomal protein L19